MDVEPPTPCNAMLPDIAMPEFTGDGLSVLEPGPTPCKAMLPDIAMPEFTGDGLRVDVPGVTVTVLKVSANAVAAPVNSTPRQMAISRFLPRAEFRS